MDGWTVVALLSGLVVGVGVGALVAGMVVKARAAAAQATVCAERDLLRAQVVSLTESVEESRELAMALAPVTSSLARVERQVGALERDRAEQWGRLDSHLLAVAASGEALRTQTAALAGALRSSGVRGSWGELQLRRVVEHTGLLAHVDFAVQVEGVNDRGQAVRPDAVVRLPGGRQIVVDAKAPLAALLTDHPPDGSPNGNARTETTRAETAHAKALRAHVESLAGKRYWSAFEPSPEFVICFVPGEGLLATACRADPGLLEYAMSRRVVLATPTTLLATLRTVALAWQQDALVGNAREVVDLGRDLHERLAGLAGATAKLGRSLNRTVEDYNTLVAATQRQVLDRSRRLADLGAGTADTADLAACEAVARSP